MYTKRKSYVFGPKGILGVDEFLLIDLLYYIDLLYNHRSSTSLVAFI